MNTWPLIENERQQAASAAFARERGWRLLTRSSFPVLSLHTGTRSVKFDLYRSEWFDQPGDGVLDHQQYFANHLRPVAIVTHSYRSFIDVREWAAERGLNVERIANSWYLPGRTVTVVLTSKGLPTRRKS